MLSSPMILCDPLRLARHQLDIDRDRTRDFPSLLPHKLERMAVSPLAFFRGAAPLYYELLKSHPSLADGPAGKGWLTGDLHLENFGAFRGDSLTFDEHSSRDASVVFDLNDFDDAFVGAWRWDVLRLATSLILGGRELGADGRRTIELCHELLDAYVPAAFGPRRKLPPMARPVAALVRKVRTRSRKALLDGRTEVVRGKRRFVRGDRYADLPARIARKAEKAFAKYVKRLPEQERQYPEAFDVIDLAFRVAGTGSLGGLRVAVLVRGKGGVNGAWIFDMKEQGTPSAHVLVRPPKMAPAQRVVEAERACLEHPPRMIGVTKLAGTPMFVRRLAPQEDKLDLTRIDAEDLGPLARYLGALVGAAHRRGAMKRPKKPWSAKDRTRLVDRAIALAGVHEATYLSLCKLARGQK
jgi:uncharacterized protein (DUF2252 family)